MKKHLTKSRRTFVKNLAATSLAASSGVFTLLAENPRIKSIKTREPFSANDQINVGFIGMGIMGFNNATTAIKVPGVQLVAACDLYKGRLTRTKEVYGSQVATTQNYRELLDRDDIDAVIISTTDHWHQKIAIEAMEKGKAVYCEKPLMQKLEETQALLDTQKRTQKVLQVGSQPVSSIVNQKAHDLYQSGTIGQLVVVESWTDRFSAMGAWQYSIPTDASPDNIDWETFIGNAPKRSFDATRFFRWRNYQDYGTGVAGDLFVHLFSGLHAVTNSLGPNRIYATGGLRYWKDGRDVADVVLGCFDYPDTKEHTAFNLQLRVNLIDGSGGSSRLRLVGTEGEMVLSGNSLTIKKQVLPAAPGFGGWDSYETFPETTQNEYAEWYADHYPKERGTVQPGAIEYSAPEGYDAHFDHHAIFFEAVRNNSKVVEDVAFGVRAAGPAVASNISIYEKRVVHWDPMTMKEVTP